MAAESHPSARTAVRVVSAAVAFALVAWAFADDSLVGGGPGFGSTQAAILLVGLALLGSCALPLAWNGRALALVLSLGFVLAFGEVAARVLFAPRFLGENEPDAAALYRPISGVVRESRREPENGGDRIVYRINSQGFRGPELEPSPRARVVVYGDSFIHAYYSLEEHTFAARLQHYLAERLGPIEVVNAGVAGYGPDQELVKMRRELPGLAPDLVLVAIFTGNDFGDLARNKLFRLEADGRLRANSFTVAPGLTREMEVHRDESVLKRVLRDTARGLAVRAGLVSGGTEEVAGMSPRARLDYFLERHVREYEEFVVEGNDEVAELAFDSYDADVGLTPNSDSARYKVRVMDGVLGEMQAAAAKSGAPLVLIPIPHPLDVGGHATGEIDREKYPDYEPRRMVRTLEEIAERRDIPYVDLYEPFAARGSEALYFRGLDDHWNDAGQDFAARIVADALVDRGLLDGLDAKNGTTHAR